MGGGYSLFVRIAKVALPCAALAIVGILIARLAMDEVPAGLSVDNIQAEGGRIELVRPRYEGVDAQGNPYTISADRASREGGNDNLISLENPLADLSLKDSGWLAVKARHGLFDREQAHLVLEKDVTLFHDQGYELNAQRVEVDIKSGRAISDLPVQAQGAAGNLQAAGMDISNNGLLVVFSGPAHLTLRLQEKALP